MEKMQKLTSFRFLSDLKERNKYHPLGDEFTEGVNPSNDATGPASRSFSGLDEKELDNIQGVSSQASASYERLFRNFKGGQGERSNGFMHARDSGDADDYDSKPPGDGDDPYHVGGSGKAAARGQLGTDFMKNVPIVCDIPMIGTDKSFKWSPLIYLLQLAILVIFFCYRSWEDNVLHDIIPLKQGLNVVLHLKNCGVHFVPSSKPFSYLEVKAWHSLMDENNLSNPCISGWKDSSDSELNICLYMTNSTRYFQCALNFYLLPEYSFNIFSIFFTPVEDYMDVYSRIPLKSSERFAVSALYAFIDVRSIASREIAISLGDGQLSLSFDGASSAYSSSYHRIRSKKAPVRIKSQHPIRISTSAEAMPNALFRGTGGASVSTTGGYTALMYPTGTPSLVASISAINIAFDGEEAPIYALSRGLDEDLLKIPLSTWAGSVQRLPPQLAAESSRQVERVNAWIHEAQSTPWMVIIQTLGDAFTDGEWQLLSSNAFLNGAKWFTFLTGGMLRPKVMKLQMHITGLYCREIPEYFGSSPDDSSSSTVVPLAEDEEAGAERQPPLAATSEESRSISRFLQSSEDFEGDDEQQQNTFQNWKKVASFTDTEKRQLLFKQTSLGQHIGKTYFDTHCKSEMLDDMFLVFYHVLEAARSKQTLVLWTPDDFYEYLFTFNNYAVHRRLIGPADTWYFLVAVSINFVCAAIMGIVAVFSFHKLLIPWLLLEDRETSILRAASHRLDHEHTNSEQKSWNIIASCVHWPCHGLLLRWSKDEEDAMICRFGVHLKLSKLAWVEAEEDYFAIQKLQQKEIFLYLPYSASKDSHELGLNQKKLFIPSRQPGPVKLESTKYYEIDVNTAYRIQIIGLNSLGRVIQKSEWSQEIILGPSYTFSDVPLLLLKRFFTPNISSLEVFLQKFAVPVSHFDIPIKFSSLRLQFYYSGINELTFNKSEVKSSSSGIFRGFTHTSIDKKKFFEMMSENDLNLKESYGKTHDETAVEMNSYDRAYYSAPSSEVSDIVASCEKLPIKLDYILCIFFGTKSHQAKDIMYKTGRRVYSEIQFSGYPARQTSSKGSFSLSEAFLELSAHKQFVNLCKDRISFNTISFEVSALRTGQLIANGSIKFEDLYQVMYESKKEEKIDSCSFGSDDRAGMHNRSSDEAKTSHTHKSRPERKGLAKFRVGLELIEGGGPWGRIECDLDTSSINSFVRHQEQPQGAPRETASVRRGRKRTDIQILPGMRGPYPKLEKLLPMTYIELNSMEASGLEVEGSMKEVAPQKSTKEEEFRVLRNRGFGGTLDAAGSGSFKRSYDSGPKVQAIPHFVRDSPSMPTLQGGDLFVQWEWNGSSLLPEHVYLHLFDHLTDQWISPLHWGRPIPNTGSYAWHVDTTFKPGQTCQLVYIAMFLKPMNFEHEALKCTDGACQSNAFFIVKPIPLSELEFAYASFCRTMGIEMEHVSEAKLAQFGYSVQEHTIKICPDLRPTLCAEPKVEAVHCPGQCLISTQSKLVLLGGIQDQHKGTLMQLESANEQKVVVYKSVSKKIKILENCKLIEDIYWWKSSPDITLIKNDIFYPIVLGRLFSMLLNQLLSIRVPFKKNETIMGVFLAISRNASKTLHSIIFFYLPIVINLALIGMKVMIFCVFPGFCVALFAFQNHSEIESGVEITRKNYENFITDLVFSPLFLGILNLKWPGPLVVVFSLAYLITMLVILFSEQAWRNSFQSLSRNLNYVGDVLVSISIFFIAFAASSFVLWFFLGALVNADSLLPYAAMVGSMLFVLGMLWMNFSSSRKSVVKFIDENLTLLLSLALDHWFESVHLHYSNRSSAVADEKVMAYRDRIRDEIKDAKLRLRRDWQFDMNEEAEERSIGRSPSYYTSGRMSIENYAKSKKRREKIIFYIFEKISSLEGFYFDSGGNPRGMEAELERHQSSRLATCHDAEKYSNKIEDLLNSWETAMLQDGIKYGPRYGYKLESRCPKDQTFQYAIIALARYPPAEDLDDLLKAHLIFDQYNKDKDDFLSEHEYSELQHDLGRAQLDGRKFLELCDYYNDILGTSILPQLGINAIDLSKIYSLQAGDLDKDYEKIFPIIRYEEMPDYEFDDLDHLTSEGESDINNDYEAVSDGEGTTSEEDEEDDPQLRDDEMDGAPLAKGAKVKKELNDDINTRKLQFIFNYSTQACRGQLTDELISSVSLLAKKILETQQLLLAPYFGREAIIGVPPTGSKLHRASSYADCDEGDIGSMSRAEKRLTDMLKVVHVEFYHELSRQFRLIHLAMFDTNAVRNGISNFYDNIMPQNISLKASKLLNDQLLLSKADFCRENATRFLSHPPKTGGRLLNAINKLLVEKDDSKDLLHVMAACHSSLKLQLQLSYFTQILYSLGVFEAFEVMDEVVEIPAEWQIRELQIKLPVRKECRKVFLDAFDVFYGNKAHKLMAEHTLPILKIIITKNLWFEAFKFLVQILGIEIEKDELPGGAVNTFVDREILQEECASQLPTGECVSATKDLEVNKVYEQNLKKMRSVFDQLSNFSGFLPLDLADEAILLLSDNRLHFSGVVACLHNLKIGSVRVQDKENFTKSLEHLGIRKDSPVCDLYMSNDVPLEHFDWTEFCDDPGWNSDLFRSFDKLTAACPGFMGKSQMYEFVREISKLFNPQVSQMRRGRDKLRRKRKGPKDRVLQLGIHNDGDIRGENDDSLLFGYQAINGEHDSYEEEMRMVSFEMFHKVLFKLGLSSGQDHSRIMWILLSSYSHDEIQQFLPEKEVKMGVLCLYLQPQLEFGKPFGPRNRVSEVVEYKGYVTYVLFRRILRALGVQVSEKGARMIWEDIYKDPFEITDFLPAQATTDNQGQAKYLRIEMDKLGMDPTKGKVASLNTIKRQLPRILCTGMWPNALQVLIRVLLEFNVEEKHLEYILSTSERPTNRYGLIKLEEIGAILSDISVKGISFSMLREVIQKMKINMPDQDIKRIFDLMDLNHDLNLSLSELLGGFSVLFGRFMPNLVLIEVGLSYERMAMVLTGVFLALTSFFSFIGIAFSSFEALKSGVSAVVQTILAVLGAVGLQSSASQEMEQVQERMRLQIEEIMGDPLSKAREQVQELQEASKPKTLLSTQSRPTHLKYIVPKMLRPDPEDPRPCVTFFPGTYVRLEPTYSGPVNKEGLSWSIFPKLPIKSGLQFNDSTGVIEGYIPQKETNDLTQRSKIRYGRQFSTEEHLEMDRMKRMPSMSTGDLQMASYLNPGKDLHVNRRTYTVWARNSAGGCKTRITFQIRQRSQTKWGKKETPTQKLDVLKALKMRKSIKYFPDRQMSNEK